mmetsp:Transcript_129282/g.258147  ORF Transcript_129282/g.258147 Transcript_129282/m.258147 type:complete len:221 (+) Transcript_129282:124-786(+)
MMCLFKPNTYDPKDWQCPKPSCRTVNFKKRMTCISCGARKPDGTHRPLDDWRDGEKHASGPWDCETCHTHNEPGAFYCVQCKRPSMEMMAMMEEEKSRRSQEEGRGGGLYDRQDPNDKKQWDSDGEEFDEFGRRKKKNKRSSSSAAAAAFRRPEPAAEGISAAGPGARDGNAVGASRTVAPQGPLADKHKAALERLRNKHATSGRGRDSHRSRSRSRRRH